MKIFSIHSHRKQRGQAHYPYKRRLQSFTQNKIKVTVTTDKLEEVELGSGNVTGVSKFSGADHLK
jgi:hypothetical protein